jgi:uncharacterized protein YndB with AHSA1/START domain
VDAINSETVRDREITYVRVFDAPRETVWSAWSEPEHVKQWWGPSGFTNTFHEFDFRPGGHWRFIMHAPNGMDFQNHNLFVEIRQPELIVMDHVEEPRFRMTAVFEDLGDKTKITFRQVFESAEACEQVKPYAIPGAHQTFDKLSGHLAALRR